MNDDFQQIQEAYSGVAQNGPYTTNYSAEPSKHSYGPHHAFNAGGAVNRYQLNSFMNTPTAISDEEASIEGVIEKAAVIELINNLLEKEESQQVQFTLANLKKLILK